MNEPESIGHIDKFVTVQPNDALPADAYDTPQGTIQYLRDGEWMALRPGSAFREIRSGLILVDTFDSTIDTVNQAQIEISPFIMAVQATSSLRRYILDLRRLRNLRLPALDLNLDTSLGDDPMQNDRMQRRYQLYGTVVVSSLLTRNYNNTVAYVESDLEVPVAQFAQQVDDFFTDNADDIRSGKSVKPPTADISRLDMQFHRPIEDEYNQLVDSHNNRKPS